MARGIRIIGMGAPEFNRWRESVSRKGWIVSLIKSVGLATAVGCASLGVRMADAAALTTAERDSITAAIQQDRVDTETWLKGSPTSYLAAVRRIDFEARPALTLGRANGNDLRVEDSTLTAHHLRVTVVGDSFHVQGIDPQAAFLVDKASLREATVPASSIGVGRFVLRLSHQRFPALILFDPTSPHFREFKGLSYYPVNLSYRYAVRLTPNPKPDTTIILSTRGNQRRAVRAGWFDFVVDGRKCRLQATRLLEPGVGEKDYSIFFRDATSGKETYGMGRYVDVESLPDGGFLLDFNRAYNPACAISEYYNCPIPPIENTLKVAIRAGERDSHYH
jgi:uncharacterized protein